MIITPVNTKKITSLRNAVFLAGPCPRENYEDDWRNDAIRILNDFGFDGDIISPTNPEYDGNLEFQTQWEHEGLCLASHILFWIPRTDEHPGFTTNIEFGEWMSSPASVVGFPKDSIRNEYIGIKCDFFGKTVHHSLEDACGEIADRGVGIQKNFFTSDTHFSAERTLELSYRPFKDVKEMDLQLISNWNKRVGSEDIVFHLGDFGNPEIFKLLNCSKMYFVKGNYEDHIGDKTVEILSKDNRFNLISSGKRIAIHGKYYYLCHEPIENGGDAEDKFWLYGHIHRLQMVKRNGINVGIDGNRFMPMSVPEIKFLRGGIEDHFDENVFTDVVK